MYIYIYVYIHICIVAFGTTTLAPRRDLCVCMYCRAACKELFARAALPAHGFALSETSVDNKSDKLYVFQT